MGKSSISEPLTDAEEQRLAAAKNPKVANPLAVWSHETTDIPAGGLHRERAASEAERADIAKALGLVSLDRLAATYDIRSITGGGWRLQGRIDANVVQSCVVTLEPIAGTVGESFNVEFWRADETGPGGDDQSVLHGPDVEPLHGDTIVAGRIVFETLSGAIDPYPRKDGATFDWNDKAAEDNAKTSPFSVLSRLKDKS